MHTESVWGRTAQQWEVKISRGEDFATFFSETWLDMRVQFRESEIWARCVVVKPGRLDCAIPSGSLFPVCTNLFIYGVLTRLFGECFFTLLCNTFWKSLWVYGSHKRNKLTYKLLVYFWGPELKVFVYFRSQVAEISNSILTLSVACFKCVFVNPTQVRIFACIKRQWHSCLKKSKFSANQDLCRQTLPL